MAVHANTIRVTHGHDFYAHEQRHQTTKSDQFYPANLKFPLRTYCGEKLKVSRVVVEVVYKSISDVQKNLQKMDVSCVTDVLVRVLVVLISTEKRTNVTRCLCDVRQRATACETQVA